ncbi:VOC family protein [Nitratireductor pacificus]|uniref:Glyoxalase-like domain-containing protein n=1 Tax=Nitratireductor pacificus pht-3B TaxID=391937 RepID=K2LM46_9HYPH|nr:VOC family protein [Nitratireductor pacificus]EKF18849.1 hypothetical protein NA2_10253 [Nitratireductor pacificus pht-3B]
MIDYVSGELGLDHMLWAVPDLDEGSALFSAATGVTPGKGGSHAGFGTRNTLASLGDQLYFEVISVDPAQENFRERAERIGRLAAPEMHTFGIRGAGLEAYRDTARALGIDASDPVYMTRMRDDGVKLQWRSIYVSDPVWGDMIPFLIDWMDSPHPCEVTPKGLTMLEFAALHPRADELREIYGKLGVRVPVRRAVTPGFLLRLDTPKGEVLLT